MKAINETELGKHVKACMNADTCCHDLRHTQAWLVERGWDKLEVVAWATRQGIACDCDTINQFFAGDSHAQSQAG